MSIDPKTLLSSTESIEVCGITITDPLTFTNNNNNNNNNRTSLSVGSSSDINDQDQETSLNSNNSRLSSRSNSRLALVAKTVGKKIILLYRQM